MKRCFSLALMLFLIGTMGLEAAEVTIPDANLESALRSALGIPNDPLTDTDLASLTSLDAPSQGIRDITGLEFCINLTALRFNDNQISDVGPLSGLTSLQRLGLADNQISNVGPLSQLTGLTELGLSGNQISDVGPLSGLTSLQQLGLNDNQISSIGALSGLTGLFALGISGNQISSISALSGFSTLIALGASSNQISDITALSGLTNLKIVVLSSNQIHDLQPLVDNAGIGAGDSVDVQDNPLDALSLTVHIPTLQARGVSVAFTDNPVPVELTAAVGIALKEGIQLRWTTTSETSNLGFHVSRSESPAGPFERLSQNLIPGQGSDASEHHYRFLDEEVQLGHTYWYRLEDITLDGLVTPLQTIRVTYEDPLPFLGRRLTLWGAIKR